MSFLKKLTKKFDELKAKFTDDDKPKEKVHEASRGESDGYYGNQSQSGPPQQNYGAPTQAYGSHQSHGGPPPLSHSSGVPPCPPGWEPRWDQNSQRWYFFEHATGRSQWEPPGHGHGGPPQFGGGAPGYGVASGAAHSQGYGGHDGYSEHEQKDKGKSNAMMYGAGGLAVGALAAGMVGHELGESFGSSRSSQLRCSIVSFQDGDKQDRVVRQHSECCRQSLDLVSSCAGNYDRCNSGMFCQRETVCIPWAATTLEAPVISSC